MAHSQLEMGVYVQVYGTYTQVSGQAKRRQCDKRSDKNGQIKISIKMWRPETIIKRGESEKPNE